MAERLDASYEPGRRSKHRRRETFAVTGWRPRVAERPPPEAISVARAAADRTLLPAGSAELGLSSAEGEQLRTGLQHHRTASRRGAHGGARHLGRRRVPRILERALRHAVMRKLTSDEPAS